MRLGDLIPIAQYASPVAIAAIGETITQRAGVINIGLEGVMLFAAYGGFVVDLETKNPWLGLAAGMAIGVVVALLFAIFAVRWTVDQVVAGTAVNLLALGATGTWYRVRFGSTGQLLSAPKVPSFAGVDAVMLFTFVSAFGVAWAIHRTQWGLAIRASGDKPAAAEAAGFDVGRLRLGAVGIGGLFAGLAGAYLSVGIAGSFAENMTAGRGFVAIAMVTFGRWRAPWVFAAALLIGLAESCQFSIQSLGLHIPFQLLIALPYVVALVVLVIVGKGTVAPQALGQPHRKDK